MIDRLDKEILTLLQENARVSNAEISRRIGRAPSVIYERLRRMEGTVIRRYLIDLNAEAILRHAFGFVIVQPKTGVDIEALGQALAAVPEILEVHFVAGEDAFLLKVSGRNNDDLMKIVQQRLSAMPDVLSTRTLISMRSYKEGGPLPLDGVGEEEEQETPPAAL